MRAIASRRAAARACWALPCSCQWSIARAAVPLGVSAAAALPTGFSSTTLGNGLAMPTSMAFAVSAALVACGVPSASTTTSAASSYLDDLRDGLRFMRDNGTLPLMATFAVANVLLDSIFAVVLPRPSNARVSRVTSATLRRCRHQTRFRARPRVGRAGSRTFPERAVRRRCARPPPHAGGVA